MEVLHNLDLRYFGSVSNLEKSALAVWQSCTSTRKMTSGCNQSLGVYVTEWARMGAVFFFCDLGIS